MFSGVALDGYASVSSNATIAKVSTPRGFPCTEPNNAYNCPHLLVTPAVASLAPRFFDCPSLVRDALEIRLCACVYVCVCPAHRSLSVSSSRHALHRDGLYL